jgi:hypothetical protein
MYTPTPTKNNEIKKRSYDRFVHNPASERPRHERENHVLIDEITSKIHNGLKISGGHSSDDVDAGGVVPANEELRYGAASQHEARMAVQTMLRNQKEQYQRIASKAHADFKRREAVEATEADMRSRAAHTAFKRWENAEAAAAAMRYRPDQNTLARMGGDSRRGYM